MKPISQETATSELDAGRKIITSYVYPPIPIRSMDWCAFYDGDASQRGWGSTEAEAIADLIDSYPDEGEEERTACHLCSGTGIGQHGDPDTSTCYACKGKGYVENDDGPDPDDERDRRRDDRLTGDRL